VPKPFDLLKEFSKYGAERSVSLRDPGVREAFGLHARAEIDRALRDPALLVNVI
jgi:hypothetical protein